MSGLLALLEEDSGARPTGLVLVRPEGLLGDVDLRRAAGRLRGQGVRLGGRGALRAAVQPLDGGAGAALEDADGNRDQDADDGRHDEGPDRPADVVVHRDGERARGRGSASRTVGLQGNAAHYAAVVLLEGLLEGGDRHRGGRGRRRAR